MAKLTKAQLKAHNQALQLLQKDRLTIDERWQVLETFHEGAICNPTEGGAFFTPISLAMDMAIDMYNGGRVLDLCAGIGTLSLANAMRTDHNIDAWPEMVCIERNPAFVEIGRKLLPEARWICCDVFDLPQLGLGHFDGVISNPPFGRNSRQAGRAPRYGGADFEFQLIDLAADHADYGCFLLPQNSAPFVVSGQRGNHYRDEGKGRDFEAATGFELHPGCGVDTAYYASDWKHTTITCEIVTVDFDEWRERNAPQPATEPTEQGLQFVIEGCERRNDRKAGQLDFWT